MQHVPGSQWAEELIEQGLNRPEVLDALMLDHGLTWTEAHSAWWASAPAHRVTSLSTEAGPLI